MSVNPAAHLMSIRGAVEFNGGAPLPAGPGETILLAGLRAGLPLPYDCASGGCGTCKARLLDGRVATLWPDAPGLSERDRRRGDRILLCQSTPIGSCQVQAVFEAGTRSPEPAPQRLRGTLLERRAVTADTAVFVIATDERVAYLPGQFVHLEFADGVRRAYSMTQPAGPSGRTALELLIRAKPDGSASRWLFEALRPGDPVRVEGPYGRAYAQSPPDRPVVCLAGGTGIAPILAIADSLQADSLQADSPQAGSPTRSLRVYVGARSIDDLVFADRLAGLRERGAHVVVAVDRGTGRDHDVLGPIRSGLVLDHLADELTDLADHDLYLAGPPPMVDAALRRLVRDGTASADRVFMDRFL